MIRERKKKKRVAYSLDPKRGKTKWIPQLGAVGSTYIRCVAYIYYKYIHTYMFSRFVYRRNYKNIIFYILW